MKLSASETYALKRRVEAMGAQGVFAPRALTGNPTPPRESILLSLALVRGCIAKADTIEQAEHALRQHLYLRA